MKRKYIEKRMLSVALTEGERLEYGEELARAQTARDEAENQKKTTGAQLGADIKARTAEVQRLAAIVNGKSKMTEVECHWTLHSPRKGQKILVRQDSKQVIETRDMDASDEQELFPDGVAELEKKPAARDVAATVMPRLPAPGESEAGAKVHTNEPLKPARKKGKKAKPEKSISVEAVNWNAVKEEYRATHSLKGTAEKFGLKPNTLKARIRREKWNTSDA